MEKRKQVIWPFLWDACEKMEGSSSLVSLCSAGILLLSEMSDEERNQTIRRTKKLRSQFRSGKKLAADRSQESQTVDGAIRRAGREQKKDHSGAKSG